MPSGRGGWLVSVLCHCQHSAMRVPALQVTRISRVCSCRQPAWCVTHHCRHCYGSSLHDAAGGTTHPCSSTHESQLHVNHVLPPTAQIGQPEAQIGRLINPLCCKALQSSQ